MSEFDFPFLSGYMDRLSNALKAADPAPIERLAKSLGRCWQNGHRVFVCGNGGSAANAMHIANDMFYGVAKLGGRGMRIHALPANVSVLTCLANDEGYDQIYSRQLAVEASPGDMLVALSGSGNSPNILEALKQARTMGVESFAVLGYSGGKAKEMADHPIHFAIDDMQIAEDLQLVLFHAMMQWLCRNPVTSP